MKKHSPIHSSSNLDQNNDFENLILKPIDQEDHKAAFDNHVGSTKPTSHPLFIESPFRRYSLVPSLKIGETNSGENNPDPVHEYLPSITDSGAMIANRNSLHITFHRDSTRGQREVEATSKSETFNLAVSPQTRAWNSNGGISPVPKVPIEFDLDVPSPSFQVKGNVVFLNDPKRELQDSQSGTTGDPRDCKDLPKPRKSVSMNLPLSPQERHALLGFKSQTLEPSPVGFWGKARRKAQIFSFEKPRKKLFAMFKKSEVKAEAPQQALQIIHDRSLTHRRTQHKKFSTHRTTTPKLYLILKKHATTHPNMNRDNSGLLNAVNQLKKLKMGFFQRLWTHFNELLSLMSVKSRARTKWVRHFKKPIKPDESLKILWDIVIMIFILVDLVLLPFRISFEQNSDSLEDYFGPYDTVQTAFFLIDIMLTFNTGFYQDGNLVKDRWKIAMSYLRVWFWIDIISSFPYEWVSNAVLEDSIDNSKQNTLLQVVKFLRFFRLIRVIRIAKLKLLITKLKYSIYTSRLFHGILSLTKLCLIISFLAHWIACGWHYIAITSEDNGWLRYKGLDTADIKARYVASLYFSVTTMLTVGYGDITPENSNEMIYAIFVMILGGGMFGYTMNSIATIVQSLEDEKTKIRKKIISVSGFMQRRGLAKDVQSSVKKYLEFVFEDEDAIGQNEKEMFNTLSTDLREKVYDQLNGRLIYQNKILTTNFSKKILYNITAIIEEKTFTPGQTVLRIRDPGDCIYFINKGTLNLFVPKTDMPFSSLTKGDHFGEAYFFQPTSRVFTVKSDGFSHLLVLRRDKFLESLNSFPQDKEIFCMIRDKIALYKDYSMLHQNCRVCGEPGHIIENCSRLQYIPPKEEVIDAFISNQNFERGNFIRKNRRKFHTLSDLPSLAEKANKVVENYPVEVLDIKTLKEVKDEENLVESPGFRTHPTSFTNNLHPYAVTKQSVEDMPSLKHTPSIYKDYETNRLTNQSKKIILFNPTMGEVDFYVKSDFDIERKMGTVWHVDSSNVLFTSEGFEFDQVRTYEVYFPYNNVNQIGDRLRRKQKSQREVDDIKRLKHHLGNFFKSKEKEKFRTMSKALSLNNSQSIRKIDASKSELLY